ncbi:MAG: peptide chain release factor family protein [Kiritimatiellia bacterium]
MDKNFVSVTKQADLAVRLVALGVRDCDLIEKFVLGSGKGGQKINKTASCVYLQHVPSGIEVKCQQERSQVLNRFFARRLLCEELESRRDGAASARQQAIERMRRQKRRKSRRQRAKTLDDKHHQSEKKSARRASASDD